MPHGMPAWALGEAHNGRMITGNISVPFLLSVNTVAGTSTYNVYGTAHSAPRGFRVIKAWGVMTGAGAAADTVVVSDGTNNITDTADLSVFSNTDQFDFSQIDDTYFQINKGGSLVVTTASGALCRVYIMCEWRD